MTVKDLRDKLKKANIPDNMYSLLIGGLSNEKYCLVKNDGGWEVYYSERGKKRDTKLFTNEAEACE